MIKESFLNLIWEKQLFNPKELYSIKMEAVEILDKGILNDGDGPDRLEAKIKVDDTILAGSVEFHVHTSDWVKHKHSTDRNYKNVVLHVVWIHDVEIPGLNCPTLELQGRVPRYYFDNYKQLIDQTKDLPCAFAVREMNTGWLEKYRTSILKERFCGKMKWIEDSFSNIKLNKIYEVFMIGFGMPQNNLGYQKLSNRISYHILNKYKDNKHKLEAILFGVSGLLTNAKNDDEYIIRLKQTYMYLNVLHKFEEMTRTDWVFLRVRPYAFPTIRLSLLADLFHRIPSLEDFVLYEQHKNMTSVLAQLKPSDYWKTHYVFNKETKYLEKSIGKTTIQKLWINVVVPLRLLYTENADVTLCEALEFLKSEQPENNKVTRLMISNGFENVNAYQSQFNLHKYKYYCIPRKCLNCGIGYKIIRNYG